MTPDQLLAALNWRYATKKFDPARKIDPALWSALEDALVLSPSSYGLQPWKFIVVNDPAVRTQLLPASWGQRQIVDASHLVVFAVKADVGPADAEKLIALTSEIRGLPLESLAMYKGMMVGSLTKATPEAVRIWMTNQVFIALGQFLTACAMVDVDACPMEGFDPTQFDEILGLSARGYHACVVATVGYRAGDCPYAKLKKVRYEKSELVAVI